jgi:hypothetical protein
MIMANECKSRNGVYAYRIKDCHLSCFANVSYSVLSVTNPDVCGDMVIAREELLVYVAL